MKKRIKNKKQKEKYFTYKGQSIALNSAYSFKGNNVVLFYCPIEGVELYFKKVSSAKRYLDSIHLEISSIKNNCSPF